MPVLFLKTDEEITPVCRDSIMKKKNVALDKEGNISIIQVAIDNDTTYIFEVLNCNCSIFVTCDFREFWKLLQYENLYMIAETLLVDKTTIF